MNAPENHILRLKETEEDKDSHVFLVLTEHVGSDFTFYLRDDGEGGRIRRILRRESGQADGPQPSPADAAGQAPRPPQPESSFTCRIRILRPLLDKDDFLREGGGDEKIIFLQRLRDAKNDETRFRDYTALRGKLRPETVEALDQRGADDKALFKQVVAGLNELLASDRAKVLFGDSAPREDYELLDDPADPAARERLDSYLRFCSLFKDAIKPPKARIRDGRALAALCYEGKFWSISFRQQESGTGYAPLAKTDGWLNPIEEICHTLYEEIFYAVGHSEEVATRNEQDEPAHGDAEAAGGGEGGAKHDSYRKRIDEHRVNGKLHELSGLVVISGSTNSAKSKVTRGLIHLYLEHMPKGSGLRRRPHLVTFEDPIEKYFAAAEACASAGGTPGQAGVAKSLEEEIDYTPRQQNLDLRYLQTGLRDALRQTPAVFFVGETRKKQDWRALLDFAGTGHLVITTAHAGSLIEAMHKIFLATEAKTPADRNEVASRLLAVVQLKRAEVAGYEQVGALVPSLWRRVPRGLNALTAEGLASILPHSHSDDEDNPCSCLGRKYFVERLLELAAESQPPRPPLGPAFDKLLLTKAIDWDLQGA